MGIDPKVLKKLGLNGEPELSGTGPSAFSQIEEQRNNWPFVPSENKYIAGVLKGDYSAPVDYKEKRLADLDEQIPKLQKSVDDLWNNYSKTRFSTFGMNPTTMNPSPELEKKEKQLTDAKNERFVLSGDKDKLVKKIINGLDGINDQDKLVDFFINNDEFSKKLFNNLKDEGYSQQQIDMAFMEMQDQLLPDALAKQGRKQFERSNVQPGYVSQLIYDVGKHISKEEFFNKNESKAIDIIDEIRKLNKEKKDSKDKDNNQEKTDERIRELNSELTALGYGPGWIDLKTGMRKVEDPKNQQDIEYSKDVNNEISTLSTRISNDETDLKKIYEKRFLAFKRAKDLMGDIKYETKGVLSPNINASTYYYYPTNYTEDQVSGIKRLYYNAKVKFEAASRLYLLNQDPTQKKGVIGTALKEFVYGASSTLVPELVKMLPQPSPSEEQNTTIAILNDGDFPLSKDEIDAISPKMYQKVSYGLGSAGGILLQFAALNEMGAALGATKLLTGLKLASEAENLTSGTKAIFKTGYWLTKGLLEEAKFKAIGGKWGAGTTFMGITSALDKIPVPKFGGKASAALRAFEILLKGDITMTAATDAAQQIEIFKDAIFNNKDYHYMMDKTWGNRSQFFDKLYVDLMTNWVFGIKQAVEINQLRRGEMSERLSKLAKEMADVGHVEDAMVVMDHIKDLNRGKAKIEEYNREMTNIQDRIDFLKRHAGIKPKESSEAPEETPEETSKETPKEIPEETPVSKKAKKILSKKISTLKDRKVKYKGETGFLKIDEGGKVTFETENKIVELNYKSDQPINETEINELKPIKTSKNSIRIGGEEINLETATINRDNDGNPVSVTYEKNGQKRTFRQKDYVDEVSYLKKLYDYNKEIESGKPEEEVNAEIENSFKDAFNKSSEELIDPKIDKILSKFDKGMPLTSEDKDNLLDWIDNNIKNKTLGDNTESIFEDLLNDIIDYEKETTTPIDETKTTGEGDGTQTEETKAGKESTEKGIDFFKPPEEEHDKLKLGLLNFINEAEKDPSKSSLSYKTYNLIKNEIRTGKLSIADARKMVDVWRESGKFIGMPSLSDKQYMGLQDEIRRKINYIDLEASDNEDEYLKERMEQLRSTASETFFNNYKSSKPGTPKERYEDAIARAKDAAQRGGEYFAKKLMGEEKEKFMKILWDALKALMDAGTAKIEMAFEKLLKDYPENGDDTDQKIRAFMLENKKELLNKNFDKEKQINNVGDVIEEADNVESVQISGEQKIETLRKPGRKFFKEMKHLGIEDPEEKLVGFSQNPLFLNAFTNEASYIKFIDQIADPDIKTMFENLSFQQALYIKNFYSNLNPMEAIAFEFNRKGTREISRRFLNKIDQLIRFQRKTKKTLNTFSYGGIKNDPGKALQKAFLDFKQELTDITNSYAQLISGAKNQKEIDIINKRQAFEKHNLYLNFLQMITGINASTWDFYFNKDFENETEYNKNRSDTRPNIIKYLNNPMNGRLKKGSIPKDLYFYFAEVDPSKFSGKKIPNSNLKKLANVAGGKDNIKLDYNSVKNVRSTSFEQTNHLIRTAKNILSDFYKSDFFRKNKLVRFYQDELKKPIELKKIAGNFINTYSDHRATDQKDIYNDDLERVFLHLYAYPEENGYLHSIGQFADKTQLYVMEAPKHKHPENFYNKLYEARPEFVAKPSALLEEAKRLKEKHYGELSDKERAEVNKIGADQFYKNFIFDSAINKFYSDLLFHGDYRSYIKDGKFSFADLVKRGGTTNTPGYVPDVNIKGGIGWKKDPKTGKEVKTNTFVHVVSNDPISDILGEEFKDADGIEFMLQDHADRFQVSMGDILSRKKQFRKLTCVKSSYSKVDQNGRRALTKGNIISIDALGKQFKGTFYEDLYKYMKKHGIDRLSFDATTKKNEGRTTSLFKDGKFNPEDPNLIYRDINDVIIQQDLRSETRPKFAKITKQLVGNFLRFDSADKVARLYNEIRDNYQKTIGETFESSAMLRDILKKEIDSDLLPAVADFLENDGSFNNPFYKNILQNALSSYLQRNALEQKINRTALQSIPQMNVFLRPMEKIGKKIALEWANLSMSGVRYSKTFDSKNKAVLFASKLDDMKDPDGSVRLHELLEKDGKWIVPGEYVMITRVPADGPRSHSLVRAHEKIEMDGNFVMVHKNSQFKAGEDNDGDKRYVQSFVRNKDTGIPSFDPTTRDGMMNIAFRYMANEYFKPKNFNIFNRILNTKIFDSLIHLKEKYKPNDPAGFFYSRERNKVGNEVISAIATFSTTYDYINKIGLNFKSKAAIRNGIEAGGFIKDQWGVVKDVIGTVLNLALDNAKDPKIEEMGINEITANMFIGLMVSNDKLNKAENEDEQLKMAINYADELIKLFTSPVFSGKFRNGIRVPGYIELERKRKSTSGLFVRDGDTKVRAKHKDVLNMLEKDFGSSDVSEIKILKRLTNDYNKIYKFVNLTRELPSSVMELKAAENAIFNIEKDRLNYISTKGLENSVHTKAAYTSVDLARNYGLKNDILMSEPGEKIINQILINKSIKLGFKNHKESFLEDENFGSVQRTVDRLFSVKALSKGETYAELNDFVKRVIAQNNDFTKYLVYDEGTNSVHLKDDYRTSEIPKEDIDAARRKFNSYKPETKRKILLYYHYVFSNSISKQNGGFFELISPEYIMEADKFYDTEKYRWQDNMLNKEEIDDAIETIELMNEPLDFSNKFKGVKRWNVLPDLEGKNEALKKISEITSEEDYRKFLSEATPYEIAIAKMIDNTREEKRRQDMARDILNRRTKKKDIMHDQIKIPLGNLQEKVRTVPQKYVDGGESVQGTKIKTINGKNNIENIWNGTRSETTRSSNQFQMPSIGDLEIHTGPNNEKILVQVISKPYKPNIEDFDKYEGYEKGSFDKHSKNFTDKWFSYRFRPVAKLNDKNEIIEYHPDIDYKPETGFQGYRGGFENVGKGTPEGDGKDKAMRQVADGFIGEIKGNIDIKTNPHYEGYNEKQKTSTATSYKEISHKKDELTPIGGETYAVPGKIIMLARNGKFKDQPLKETTKDNILRAHKKGAEFVVGDMPDVDSQFIDYLQKIGARFTIYHTGDKPRIDVISNKPEKTPDKILFKRDGNPEYKFLSNMYRGEFNSLNGTLVKSAEHYFQASKAKNIKDRQYILQAPTPEEARKRGKEITIRDDWEEKKEKVMEKVLRQKFSDPSMKQRLIATGKADLIHDAPWGDTFWGMKNNEGKNRMGVILEKLRSEFQEENKKDIIDRLEALKFGGKKLYSIGPLALPIITWNGIIASAQVGIRAGRGIKEVADEISRIEMTKDWTEDYLENNPKFQEDLSLAIQMQMDRYKLARENKNWAMVEINNQITNRIEKEHGINLYDSDNTTETFMNIFHEKLINRKLTEDLDFTTDELNALTQEEKVHYYNSNAAKGTIETTNEFVSETDPLKTRKYIKPLTEAQYHKAAGLTELVKAIDKRPFNSRDMHTRIPRFMKLRDVLENSETDSYRNYLEDLYRVRGEFNKLEGEQLDSMADLNFRKLSALRDRLTRMNKIAAEPLMNFVDKLMKYAIFHEAIKMELAEGPFTYKPGLRGLDQMERGRIKDFRIHKFTHSGVRKYILHRHNIDADTPLVQFFAKNYILTMRRLHSDQAAFAESIKKLRNKLGLQRDVFGKGLRSTFKVLTDPHALEKEIYFNNPDYLIHESEDEFDDKKWIIQPNEINFSELLGRKITAEHYRWARGIAMARAQENEADLENIPFTDKEIEKINDAVDLLMEIRNMFSKYHPKYAYISQHHDDFNIELPKVYMSKNEARIRFGFREGSKMYDLMKPTRYDYELIDTPTGEKTFGDLKIQFSYEYKNQDKAEQKKMETDIKNALKNARDSYNRGGRHPDLRKINQEKKTIPRGTGQLSLAPEFTSNEFWYILDRTSSSLMNHYHKSMFEPVATFISNLHEGLNHAKAWLDSEINHNIFGVHNEKKMNGENLQKLTDGIMMAGAYAALPFNMFAASSNVMAGYTQNLVNEPLAISYALSKLLSNPAQAPKLLMKAHKLMEELEIATVVRDTEVKSFGSLMKSFNKFAFWTMETSEMAIQTPLFIGLMKDAINDYDSNGRLIPGRQGISLNRAIEIKSMMQNIHGAYGDSRAQYEHFLVGRAIAQFRLPWMQALISNYFGSEKTDMFGNYRIGAFVGGIKQLQLLAYNASSPERRKRISEKYRGKLGEDFYNRELEHGTLKTPFNQRLSRQLIAGSEGDKVDLKEMPRDFMNSLKRSGATAAAFIASQVLRSILKSEIDRLKATKDPNDDWKVKYLTAFHRLATIWGNDTSLIFNPMTIADQTSRPFPAMSWVAGFGAMLTNLALLPFGGGRYKTSDAHHARGEAKALDYFWRIMPVIGRPYLHAKTVLRLAKNSPEIERFEHKKDMIFTGIVQSYVMSDLMEMISQDTGPFDKEKYTRIAKERYRYYINSPERMAEITQIYKEKVEELEYKNSLEEYFWSADNPDTKPEQEAITINDELELLSKELSKSYENKSLRKRDEMTKK